jgi:sec-independent protein translocase protein TatB
MFDFDAGKLLIIGVIALIVIGPKELPRVLRQVGQFVGRMRRMAAEFQGQFMDAMKEADLQSIRDEVEKLSKEPLLDVHFDPARDIQNELTRTLETNPATTAPALESVAPAPLPTDGFSMPAAGGELALLEREPEAADMAEPESATLAAAGLAPVAAEEPAAPGAVSRKRKILLRKRRPVRIKAHEVWDRTAARRGRTAGLSR